VSIGEINAARYLCCNPGRAKRKGKLLKKELTMAGYKVGLSRCYDLIARMYGFRDWHDLVGSMGGDVIPSPDDEAVDEDLFTRRFWYQVEKLTDIGVSQTDAENVIDRVRPTSATSLDALSDHATERGRL
jgi:hypothetical protein